MPPDFNTTPPPHTLPLPRILCLHGGGTSAPIFRSQMRAFLSHPLLVDRFRFVFANAPFPCAEGVGIKPVYEDWGPFRRWTRWRGEHEIVGVEEARSKIWEAIKGCMEEDDQRGAEGEWVGLWGFSQGAKMVGSLLLEGQLGVDSGGDKANGGGVYEQQQQPKWAFGVLCAGRCPFVALSEEGEGYKFLQSMAGLPDEADVDLIAERPDLRLRTPTVHVHGLRDEGLPLHRRAVAECCAPGTTTVVEWDGPHRVPIKQADVERVVKAVVELADEYGV